MHRTRSKDLCFALGLFNDNNLRVHPYLHLGHLHIQIFGVFAALGLMAALVLSQQTARYVQLAPEAVWNACTTAILSAFFISRLLLIGFNLHSFLRYPLLVLALPSLTATGVILTALFMLGYTRWRKLPLLPLIDAIAPCFALLWVFLSLGHFFEGTRDGMPLHDGSRSIHPVEIYTAIVASFLCLILLPILRAPHREGKPSAVALISSGLTVFFVDFFRLPSDLLPNSPFDPSQIIGITMILVSAVFFLRAKSKTERESGTEPPHAI